MNKKREEEAQKVRNKGREEENSMMNNDSLEGSRYRDDLSKNE